MPNEEAYIQAIYEHCTKVKARLLVPHVSMPYYSPPSFKTNNQALVNLQFEWHQALPAGWVHLRYIEACPPRRGYGSVVMKHLCQQADNFDISLFLEAVPLGKRHVDIPQTKLISWYHGFGFRQSSKVPCSAMERPC